MISVIWQRLIAAVSVLPDAQALWQTGGLLLLTGSIALLVGFLSQFLQLDVVPMPWHQYVKIVAVSLVTPAIAEELFFRVILLPHPAENAPLVVQGVWAIASLVLFILYHPLNASTFFPAGSQTFGDLRFLCLAMILGISCTLAYLRSGCFWLPVLIHWLLVVVWLLLLGGYRKLYA